MNHQKPLERNLRILVIDDQENIHEDYRKIIGRRRAEAADLDAAAMSLFERKPLRDDEPDGGFELDSAFQGEEGYRMVQQAIDEGRPYAMAFVDIRMPPGWDGVQTVRRIWEIDTEILIVICSAYSDYSWEQMVQELGRTDRFLILKKPFDIVEVRQFAMALTQRWSLARTDALTGALNRRSLQEQLEREWAKSVRYETPLSCAMLDLDYFKKINDLEGHLAGDAVLKSVATTIHQQCRAGDMLFRYGGEEFCIVLPQTTEEQAAEWAERTRQAIAATSTPFEHRMVRVTASMGVAQRMLDTRSAAALVNRADEALRIAKQAGRNRVIRCSVADSPLKQDDLIAPLGRGAFRGAVASDVMSLQVAWLNREATIGEAARFFLDRGLNSAPVIDADGKLIGVLSEKDVLGEMLAPGAWFQSISQIYQTDVVSFDEQAPLEEIFHFLSRVSMRRVIIVREERPVGSISRTNLLRWFSNWALSRESVAGTSDTRVKREAPAHFFEAVRVLAVRATRLADELSAWETGGVLEDDLYGPLIGSVAAMQDLLRDVITFFSVKPGGVSSNGVGGIEGLDVLNEARIEAGSEMIIAQEHDKLTYLPRPNDRDSCIAAQGMPVAIFNPASNVAASSGPT